MRDKIKHIAYFLLVVFFLSCFSPGFAGYKFKTVERLRGAAKKGNSESMFYLGFMYKNGRGVEKDFKKAYYWYRRAAYHKNTEAMNCLAEMYKKGEGVKKDGRKMIAWYERAAEAGNSNSMFYLAVIYDRGKEVKRDFDKAIYWYKQAAKAGDTAARYWLENLKNKDDTFGKNQVANEEHITSESAAEDVKKTEKGGNDSRKDRDGNASFSMSADLMYTLGSRYYDGIGVDRNYEKAFEWFMKAAQAGSTAAMVRISSMYMEGKGVGKDRRKAALWAQKAAVGGNSKGMEMLGKVYINGSYNTKAFIIKHCNKVQDGKFQTLKES